MPKSTAALALRAVAPALAACSLPASAAVLGPHAAACAGPGPAMLVRVDGFKARTGMLRVQSYGGDPAHFFDKGTYLTRLEVAPPAAGPAELCLPVPKAGTYAVSVRHDVTGNHKTELSDGGGMSGNPNVSLTDVLFKRRPPTSEVAVDVHGVKTVPITLYYVHGMSFGPIAAPAR